MRLEAPPAFVFHSANAYEGGGRLVADCVCYAKMPDFEQAWHCRGASIIFWKQLCFKSFRSCDNVKLRRPSESKKALVQGVRSVTSMHQADSETICAHMALCLQLSLFWPGRQAP